MAPAFLKLNKIWDWVPEPFDDYDMEWVPYELRDHYIVRQNEGDVVLTMSGSTVKAGTQRIKKLWVTLLPWKGHSYMESFPPGCLRLLARLSLSIGRLSRSRPRREFIGQLIREVRAYYKG